MNRIKIRRKMCKCRKSYGRTRYKSGRLESVKDFNNRIFCSKGCAKTKDVVTDRQYYRRAEKHKKNECEVCDSKHKLLQHHCNQCIDDNREENLQTLCKTCSDEWHDYCTLHGIYPAGRMPKLELMVI